jgi:hypothetical protein
MFCVTQNASGMPDTVYWSCGMGTVRRNIDNRLLRPILTGLTGPFPVQRHIVVQQISGVRVESVFGRLSTSPFQTPHVRYIEQVA